MKKQKEKFINGCIKNGLSHTKAEEIFTLIEPFAGYGFNKAHAACYAMIAYQTAYLKANFPVEYMTAVLTAESRANTGPTRDDKISNIISECRRMNISILPPDINASDVEFSIDNGSIRFGLSAIKNVGTAAIESILKTRSANKKFTSLGDVLTRVDLSKVNKKTLESLIKTGAMDAFGNRAQLLSVLPELTDGMHKKKKADSKGQSGLFDSDDTQKQSFTDTLPEIPELTNSQLLSFEKELLGFYLTAHPLSFHEKELSAMHLQHIGSITEDMVGSRVVIAGLVVDVKRIFTKAGNNEMAFVKLQDLTGTIECVVFPKLFAQQPTLWTGDAILQIHGRIDQREDRYTIIVESGKYIDFTH
jgi:DNA polymerase-3 subunit alpha